MNKRITVKDVALRAGVSYQTVSKVINGKQHVLPETEERIWQAARELGYMPHQFARNLRTQRSRMIGYSWRPALPDQANHILDMFMTSMVEEAEAANYHLLPFPFHEGTAHLDDYKTLIDSGRADGFVISSVEYHDARVTFLQERAFPFVAFGRSDAGLDFPFVDVDGSAGIQLATEHLISQGRDRIALLGWPENSRVGDDRLQGYVNAMRAAHLPIDPDLVARVEGTFELGKALTQHWLARGPAQRPTGIVALSDTLAIGAIHAAQECGVNIPQDLAVIGFDDAPMAQYLWPPLTSIRQPIREAGHKCIEMLTALLEGKNLEERQVILKPKLIVRASA
ncbi:HTH-type transcriptional repressor CytR [Thermoflexales bacterium]|nr:HTH-type transcriptional repressor CytR [Thermoflexales bacterium]